jgi:hypothetical protein
MSRELTASETFQLLPFGQETLDLEREGVLRQKQGMLATRVDASYANLHNSLSEESVGL